MISGQYVFRQLADQAFIARRDNTGNCGLCVDGTGVCSTCVAVLLNTSRDKKREIYRDLISVGDKARAERLARHFTVFPNQPTAKAKAPTREQPNKLEVIDVRGPRKRLGLTQEAMAEKLGVSRSLLALVESGKRALPASAKDRLLQAQWGTTTPCNKSTGNPHQTRADLAEIENRESAELA